MLRTPVFSAPYGLVAAAVLAMGSELCAVAQRPSYPIVREILVRQDCSILLAPAESIARKKKARFEYDETICHLETFLTSQHLERSVEGKEQHRSRVVVQEQEYVLQNISDDPEVFVVEQNVPRGWRVDSDPQPVALIPVAGGEARSNHDQVAVFRVHVQPGEAVRLHVGERHTTPLKTKVLKAAQVSNSGDL